MECRDYQSKASFRRFSTGVNLGSLFAVQLFVRFWTLESYIHFPNGVVPGGDRGQLRYLLICQLCFAGATYHFLW